MNAEKWRQFAENFILPQHRLVFGCPLDEPSLLDYCPSSLSVRCSDERTAGYAAYGFSHATNRVSFLCLETGPSFTHALSPIAEAVSAELPLVIFVVATEENRRGYGAFQDLDIVGILNALDLRVHTVNDSAHTATVLRKSIEEAETNQRPVAVISRTLSGSTLEKGESGSRRWYQKEQAVAWTYSIKEEAFETAVERLSKERSSSLTTVMIVGSGARKSDLSALEILKAAHKWRAKILVTASGRGAVDERWPEFKGLAGLYATPEGIRLLNSADRIITLGSALEETARERWAPKTGCELTIIDKKCVNIPEHNGPRINIYSDVARFVRATIDKIPKPIPLVREKTRVSAALPRMAHVWRQIEDLVYSTQAEVVCFENGLCDLWGYDIRWFSLPPERSTVLCAEQSGMGVGLCGSLGIAATGKSVIAICGDATVRMNLSALTDCVEKKLPILLIVLCNESMGWPGISRKGINDLAEFPWNKNLPSVLETIGLNVFILENGKSLSSFESWQESPSAIFVDTKGTSEPF